MYISVRIVLFGSTSRTVAMFVLVCDWFDNDLVLMVVCINISSDTCMKYVKLYSFAFLCLSSWVGSRMVAMCVLVRGCFDDVFFYGTNIGSRMCIYIGVYGLHSTYGERRGYSLALEKQWEQCHSVLHLCCP